MTNQNEKGKRVERSVVNWLKERNCASARRTQQNCGKPLDSATGKVDNSDVVVPEELPNWHIESKGTKGPSIVGSKLRSWFKQVETDCPIGKVPVIFHVANGHMPICIVDSRVFLAIVDKVHHISTITAPSVNPSDEIERTAKLHRVSCALKSLTPNTTFISLVAYEVTPGTVAVFMDANLWLKWALAYEEKLKGVQAEIKEDIAKAAETLKPKLTLAK